MPGAPEPKQSSEGLQIDPLECGSSKRQPVPPRTNLLRLYIKPVALTSNSSDALAIIVVSINVTEIQGDELEPAASGKPAAQKDA